MLTLISWLLVISLGFSTIWAVVGLPILFVILMSKKSIVEYNLKTAFICCGPIGYYCMKQYKKEVMNGRFKTF